MGSPKGKTSMAQRRTQGLLIICVAGRLMLTDAQGAPLADQRVAQATVPTAPAAAEGAPPPPPVGAPGASPAGSAAAPQGAPGGKHPLFSGAHLGAYAQFSEIPGLLLGFNYNALVVAGGFTFVYDGNGVRDPSTNDVTTKHIGSSLTVGAAYVFYNQYPFAYGPELGYTGSLAPGSAFDRQTISAGMAFYFAPFAAPLVLVTLLSTRTTLTAGRDARFEFVTPSVLVGYAIH
jgi:hypothetical protein